MAHGRHNPVERVNDKHSEELLALGQLLGNHPEATSARAAQIDARGIDLVLATPNGPIETRIAFAEPVADPRRMRAAFRELTRRCEAARTPTSEPSREVSRDR